MRSSLISYAVQAFIGIVAITFIEGCSGDVSTQGSTTSSSSSSSSSSGGAGGNGGGGAGGNGGAACGGIQGLLCAADEWCDFANDMCGGDDDMGVCTKKPMGCDDNCPGVCGCDGQFYCNACGAQTAGVDISALISCAPGQASYAASGFSGGLDHIFIQKADPVRNICLQMHIAAPYQNTAGFDFIIPKDWGVQGAFITNQASDCKDPPGQVMGTSVQAAGGAGTIEFTLKPMGFFPCTLSIHGSLAFASSEPWVPSMEALDADMLVVSNGCF